MNCNNRQMNTIERISENVKVFRTASEISQRLLEQSKGKDENSFEYYSSLGQASYLLREYDLSLELLLKAYSIKPESSVASKIAMTYSRLSNPIDAVKWMEIAIQMDPSGDYEAMILNQRIPFNSLLFNFMVKAGRFDEARSLMETKRLVDDDPIVLSANATIDILKGDFESAVNQLSIAYDKSDDLTRIKIQEQLELSKKLSDSDADIIPLVEKTIIAARWPD